MKYTITETPVLGAFFRGLAKLLLKLMGWKKGAPPPSHLKQYLVVCAPHTTNWDAFMILLFVLAFGINKKSIWLGKRGLFKFPTKTLYTWLGGIPVDRGTSKEMVTQAARHFQEHEYLYLLILPEGTRHKTDYWKTGFYYIAQEAGIPIACIYGDYRNKIAGFGPVLDPREMSIDEVFSALKDFYRPEWAKYPERVGPVRYRKE